MEEFKLDGAPYFLHQKENGLYSAVACIQVPSLYDIRLVHADEQFSLGGSLVETPNQGIELALITPPDVNSVPLLIEECRKYAQLTMHNYVFLDFDDLKPMITIQPGGHFLQMFSPRLFNRRR
jgi:hypothetical protein